MRKRTMKDLMEMIDKTIKEEFAKENTCGSYNLAKKYVRSLLDAYGLRLVTDKQVTMIVNRNWRTA